MTSRVARVAVCAAAVALVATACGPNPGASIAMRSTALNLEFARPDLAKPIPPRVLIKLLPLPPAVNVPIVPGTTQTFPPVAVVVPRSEACPPAKAKAKPAAALKPSTLGSPAYGYYTYDSNGSATVSGGSQTTTVDVPPRTEVAVSKPTFADPDATVAAEGGAPASGKETEYTVTTHLSDKVSQVDELMVSATSINLMQRTLSDGLRTLTFTPTPQVQLVKFGAVGSSWKSDGSDSASGSEMHYQGTIAAIRQIDVCGQLVKGYVVSYTSSLANPAVGEIIRTNSSDANTMLVAPQLGGLVLSQHVDTDDIRFNASLNGYLDVMLKYDTTVHRLTPSASPTAT